MIYCPDTHQDLRLAATEEVDLLNTAIEAGTVHRVGGGAEVTDPVDDALVRADGLVAYPVRDDIAVLMVEEGIAIGGVLVS